MHRHVLRHFAFITVMGWVCTPAQAGENDITARVRDSGVKRVFSFG